MTTSTASRSAVRPLARRTPAARSTSRSTAIDAIALVLTERLDSRYGPGAEADGRRAAGAASADRRRRWSPAGGLDGHLGAGKAVPARGGFRDGRARGNRRGRQPVVHARRRLRAGAADRRPP